MRCTCCLVLQMPSFPSPTTLASFSNQLSADSGFQVVVLEGLCGFNSKKIPADNDLDRTSEIKLTVLWCRLFTEFCVYTGSLILWVLSAVEKNGPDVCNLEACKASVI